MVTLVGRLALPRPARGRGLHALPPLRRLLGGLRARPGRRRRRTRASTATPFLDLLNRFFQSQGLSTDWDAVREAEDELLINSISMLCPFPPEDKQALLEAPTLPTRRETLVTLIEFALRGGEDRRDDAMTDATATPEARARALPEPPRPVPASTRGCSRRWSARRPTAPWSTTPSGRSWSAAPPTSPTRSATASRSCWLSEARALD